MRAFDKAKKAKERSRPWWLQVESDEEAGPGRFRRPTGRGEAEQPPEPTQAKQPESRHQAERPREAAPGKMNPWGDWDALLHETRFTDEEPDQPVDSAGHDEVVYVGLAGGMPQRLASAIGEMKTSIQTQEALYAEAQDKADRRAKLIAALGQEQTSQFLEFQAQKKQFEAFRA